MVLSRNLNIWLVPLVGLLLVDSTSGQLHRKIDRLLQETLADSSAQEASDAQFARRAYLDLAGVIPGIEDIREFLRSKLPDKRTRLIHQLLESPRFARNMAHKFDLLLMQRRKDREQSKVKADRWLAYLYRSFRDNKSWKRLATEVLSSTGARQESSAAIRFYLERVGNFERLTRDVSSSLLGKNLHCAQCHDHPTIDDFEQSHFYGLTAFYTRTSVDQIGGKPIIVESTVGDTTFSSALTKESGKTAPRIFQSPPLVEPAEVVRLAKAYRELQQRLKTHDKNIGLAQKALATAKKDASQNKDKNKSAVRSANKQLADAKAAKKKHELAIKKARNAMYRVPPGSNKRPVPLFSRFEKMGEQVTAHPAFARNMANRLWAHMFGRGIVEPLDMHHRSNPPTHPQLLKLLAGEFAAMNYDVRRFLEQLAMTRLYQSKSFARQTKSGAEIARPIRKLDPYQLSWSILVATGRVAAARSNLPANIKKSTERARLDWDAFFLDRRMAATLAKDLEEFVSPFVTSVPGQQVRSDYTPAQALFLLNGKPLQKLLEPATGNLVHKLSRTKDKAIARTLFLTVLSRPPTRSEQTTVATLLKDTQTAQQRSLVLQDLAWSVITSSEFRFNR